jgi:hypothetical protein
MGRGGIVFLLSPKHTQQGEEVIARVDGPCSTQGVCAWGKINRESNGEEKETTAKK